VLHQLISCIISARYSLLTTQSQPIANRKEVRKMVNTKTKSETFKVKGEEMLKKVKDLIKEGNVRKITIKDKNGKTLIVFPLSIGVVGIVLAPLFAAVGALAALVTECSISVERE